MSVAAALVVAMLIAACGGGAPAALTTTPPPSPTPTAVAAATPAATPTTASAGAVTFIVSSGSSATVRVREQLAGLSAPNDAVLTTTSVSGRFTLNVDGTFASNSKITVQLATLASDSRQRDSFVKDNTLATRSYPTADFVPVRAIGLALPLAASGELTFRLGGTMTLHGVAREATFAVRATAAGDEVRATATNDPTWKFADYRMEVPRVFSVLSIVDEIRLEVILVAKAAPRSSFRRASSTSDGRREAS